MFWRRRLSRTDRLLLARIAAGWTLKSHRSIDGDKVYRLYPPDGEGIDISFAQVRRLLDSRLITTNQKFPAATFLLTTRGQQAAARFGQKVRGVGGTVHFDT